MLAVFTFSQLHKNFLLEFFCGNTKMYPQCGAWKCRWYNENSFAYYENNDTRKKLKLFSNTKHHAYNLMTTTIQCRWELCYVLLHSSASRAENITLLSTVITVSLASEMHFQYLPSSARRVRGTRECWMSQQLCSQLCRRLLGELRKCLIQLYPTFVCLV